MAGSTSDIIVRTKWHEIKEEIQRRWDLLTDDELNQVNGDFSVLTGLIQEKYGTASDKVRAQLDELTAEFRREIKEEKVDSPVNQDRNGVRGHLMDQFRQF